MEGSAAIVMDNEAEDAAYPCKGCGLVLASSLAAGQFWHTDVANRFSKKAKLSSWVWQSLDQLLIGSTTNIVLSW